MRIKNYEILTQEQKTLVNINDLLWFYESTAKQAIEGDKPSIEAMEKDYSLTTPAEFSAFDKGISFAWNIVLRKLRESKPTIPDIPH